MDLVGAILAALYFGFRVAMGMAVVAAVIYVAQKAFER